MKKGFTLVELLAVLVILATLLLITIPLVGNIINQSKLNSYKRSIDSYGDAAELALQEYQDEYDGYPENFEDIEPYMRYKGNKVDCDTKVISGYGVYLSECRVQNTLIENYSYGEILICEYANEGKKGEVGSKYTCHLDIDRSFYILEVTDNNLSLLMDRNFSDEVVPMYMNWCPDGSNNNETCENINDVYLPHIQKLFGNYVIVSFPSAEQIGNADGINYLDQRGLSNEWLFINLTSTSRPYGYWTSTPSSYNVYRAWDVDYYGDLQEDDYISLMMNGVRPVITINKNQLE